MNWANSDLLFLPVGGSEQIGMNANLYHYQDKWILVDLGISFPDETDLGVDVLLPDFDFIKSLGDKFLGIFLTHGHEDHIGAIPYFADKINCPIWGTAFTIALLKRKLKENNNTTKLVLNILSKNDSIELGDFIIKTVQTSHSIPDPVSFLISTSEGDIFHSGDWKLEQAKNLNESFDLDVFRSLGSNGVLAMVCDSTNSLVDGRTPSEDFAYEGLYETIKDKKGAVLVTCFSSNISRIKSILYIALKTDRSILVIGRALLRAIDAAKEVGYLKNIPEFLNLKDFNVISRSNILVIATGSQGEPNSALSRISRNADKHINLIKGDTLIFSSRKIPGNENAITKVQNRFLDNGVELITDEDKNIHVSGHPSRDELIEMYSFIKPKISIPVHGTREHIEAHAKLANDCQVANIIKPRNGDVIKLNSLTPTVLMKKNFTTNVFDAGEVVPIDNDRFISRRHTLWNGFVHISIILDIDGYLVSPPQITQTGVSDKNSMEDFLLDCSLKIENFFSIDNFKEKDSDEQICDYIKRSIRKYFKASYQKRPSINVHLIRI
ncbi:ribonuclease J [Alphaproteobacteria bacterium]|nr:ribonuclease J [Alphaproteobacteria bacterium]